MYIIIASSPNFPTRYHLADNTTDAKQMIDDLKYLCWNVEVKYVPVVNEIVVKRDAMEARSFPAVQP